MISQISSKWVYRKFSFWCFRHQPAMMDPPRKRFRSDVCGSAEHSPEHAGMNGEVIHALFGLFDQGVAETSQLRSAGFPSIFSRA